jgi:hypothetical protein
VISKTAPAESIVIYVLGSLSGKELTGLCREESTGAISTIYHRKMISLAL